MKNKTGMVSAIVVMALLGLAAVPVHAEEKMTVKTGYLTCHEARWYL